MTTHTTDEQTSDATQPSLESAFVAWFKEIGLPRHLPGVETDQLKTMQEVSDFLHSRDWSKEWKSGR